MDKKAKILILFYSWSGATAKLAREVGEGSKEIEGVEVEIKQIPELVPKEAWQDKPEIKASKEALEKEFPLASIDDLVEADGIAIGTPTHFGTMASQVKQFIDRLTPAWLGGKLVNKPVAFFCTSGSLHAGEELTLFSMIIPALNLGMIPVGIPYPIQGAGPDFDSGSPYGAIFITGAKGDNELSQGDKKVARILGRRLAAMTRILNCEEESCKKHHTLMRAKEE